MPPSRALRQEKQFSQLFWQHLVQVAGAGHLITAE